MKNFLVFILILVCKVTFACGFYPYGEELRFSFFNPDAFNYYSFSEFNYSANTFAPNGVYRENDIRPNDKIWFEYCSGKVSCKAISEAIYKTPIGDINAHSKNEMIKYFFRTNDLDAINYLKFAKNCEYFNSAFDDPWERNEILVLPKRTKLINKAIGFSKTVKNEELKLRYSFLAIRMAYYNGDTKKIKELYDAVFKVQPNKTILNYWSLYFRTLAELDKPLANFYAAQVFVNAPDKRFMIAQQYNSEIAVDSVLKYAKTNAEIANVYLLAGIKKSDKSLAYLKKVYKYNPKFEGLSFLLLREINKIEDWVFTPYYSLFNPSVDSVDNWQEGEHNSIRGILQRVESDRAYAGQVLQFVNDVNLNKVDNPLFWKMSKAQLLFVTKQYSKSLDLINSLEANNKGNKAISNQLEIMKAMSLTANQQKGNAVILDDVKSIILKNKANKKFLFVLGRELEYKGNTSDAALLYSKIGNEYEEYYEEHNYYNVAFWKTKKNKGNTYTDFYENYFDYIDVLYTPQQVDGLIVNIHSNKKNKDVFSIWKYGTLIKEIPRLYDLAGTKYIRQNNLDKALINFKKVENKYWDDTYAGWEKKEYTWDGNNEFDKNPFYELEYTPEFIPIKDAIKLNKKTITRQLIKYLSKAENRKEQDKDYYYFLIANCYYNMTHYGNAWMMKRYNWSSTGSATIIEDEMDYYQCDLAQKYYLLAFKNAKKDKFKALCLRMIARCEKNKMVYRFPDRYDDEIKNYTDFIFNKNNYYKELKMEYPDDYGVLTSNCNSFQDYFKARR